MVTFRNISYSDHENELYDSMEQNFSEVILHGKKGVITLSTLGSVN